MRYERPRLSYKARQWRAIKRLRRQAAIDAGRRPPRPEKPTAASHAKGLRRLRELFSIAS